MGAWLAELFIALAAGKLEQFKKLRKFCAWAILGGWVVYLDTCKDKFQAIQNICLVLKMLIVLEITWYRDLILTERESLVLPCLSPALILSRSWELLSDLSIANPGICLTSAPSPVSTLLLLSQEMTAFLARLAWNGKKMTVWGTGCVLSLN